MICLVVAASPFAQSKILSMEDAMIKNRSVLAPASLRFVQFLEATDDVVYLDTKGSPAWMKKKANGNDEVVLSLSELNAMLKKSKRDTLAQMPPIDFKSSNWTLTVKGEKIAVNKATGNINTLADKTIFSKPVTDISKAGYIAFVDNHNLYVTDGTQTTQVTNDGSEHIVYANTVHREEFGISKGTFWSNDGKTLAFYRMDQSMVNDYPIPDYSTIPAKNINIKYPMAGTKSHHVTVGIYNTETKKLLYLNTGEPAEQYLTNISWTPDNRKVLIAVVNRGQNEMKLNLYDAITGSFDKTLFIETDDRYVEPLQPAVFLKNNPDRFIWQSNRDGYNHLYLYDISGKLIQQLTKGSWEVTELKEFDASGENVFYTSTEVSPLTRHLYKLNLKSGKIWQITQEWGVHNTQISTNGTAVIDVYSNANTPRAVNLITKDGKRKEIFSAANPLQDYILGEMSIFSIKNNSGDDIYCRLYKPVNFDSTKKYPVVVYWYGGPHAQLINAGYNGGAGDYWFQYMAQRGYLVFSIDPRGSDNRGKTFEQSIFRRAGDPQMEDLLSGIGYLAAQGYADTSRMGLFGWSYGGFMTTNFMLTHPDIFKAAVAGGPVTDWAMYEIMYGERYMDTPDENPEGYKKTNLSNKVQNLKNKLLLIHGLQDPVVVQQHSINLIKAAVNKNIQIDYMVYPGHEHNVIGKDRAHLYQKVTDYLMENIR